MRILYRGWLFLLANQRKLIAEQTPSRMAFLDLNLNQSCLIVTTLHFWGRRC